MQPVANPPMAICANMFGSYALLALEGLEGAAAHLDQHRLLDQLSGLVEVRLPGHAKHLALPASKTLTQLLLVGSDAGKARLGDELDGSVFPRRQHGSGRLRATAELLHVALGPGLGLGVHILMEIGREDNALRS